MEIELISFGKISEFLASQRRQVTGIGNTEELKQHLEEAYPPLSAMKYVLALNHVIVQTNCVLAPNDIVAILPPFSGG